MCLLCPILDLLVCFNSFFPFLSNRAYVIFYFISEILAYLVPNSEIFITRQISMQIHIFLEDKKRKQTNLFIEEIF